MVEEHHIPLALILNIDHTPLNHVFARSESLAEKGAKDVTVEGQIRDV